jgi:hypothetical protein
MICPPPFLLAATTSAGPDWWTEQQVIASNTVADDYAALNQGQLKALATKAAMSMWRNLAGVNLGEIRELTDKWSILQADGTRIPRPTSSSDDYAVVTLGQLKAVARPFYDVLVSAGERPWNDPYPWSNATNPADDYAVANIGQAKYLFSFDIFQQRPSSSDMLVAFRDVWKHLITGDPATSLDSDPGNTGYTLRQRFEKIAQGLRDPGSAWPYASIPYHEDFEDYGVVEMAQVDVISPWQTYRCDIPYDQYAPIVPFFESWNGNSGRNSYTSLMLWHFYECVEGRAGAIRHFARLPESGDVTLTFWMTAYLNTVTTEQVAHKLESECTFLEFNGIHLSLTDRILARDGQTGAWIPSTVTSSSVEEWRRVEIVFNNETRKYRVSVNGTLCAQDVDFIPDTENIRLHFLPPSERVCHIDDIEMTYSGDDPYFKDSDGDGIPDWWEAQMGSNPNDPNDVNSDPGDTGFTYRERYEAMMMGKSDPAYSDNSRMRAARLPFVEDFENFEMGYAEWPITEDGLRNWYSAPGSISWLFENHGRTGARRVGLSGAPAIRDFASLPSGEVILSVWVNLWEYPGQSTIRDIVAFNNIRIGCVDCSVSSKFYLRSDQDSGWQVVSNGPTVGETLSSDDHANWIKLTLKMNSDTGRYTLLVNNTAVAVNQAYTPTSAGTQLKLGPNGIVDFVWVVQSSQYDPSYDPGSGAPPVIYDPTPDPENIPEDSDGDGFSDHVERSLGFDPDDPDSKPRPRYGIIDMGPISDDEWPTMISESNEWVLTNKGRRWNKGVWHDQPLDHPEEFGGTYSITSIGSAGEMTGAPYFGMEGYYFNAEGTRIDTTAGKNTDYGTFAYPYKFLSDGRTAYICAARGGNPATHGGSVCTTKRQTAICPAGGIPQDVNSGMPDVPQPGKCVPISFPIAMSDGGAMIYSPYGWILGLENYEARALYDSDVKGSLYVPYTGEVAVEDLVLYPPEANLGALNSNGILVGNVQGQPVWAKDGELHDLPLNPLVGAVGSPSSINDMDVIAAPKHVWERSRDKDGNLVEPIAYDPPEKVAALVEFNSGWTDGWQITGTNAKGQFIAIGYKIKEGQEKRTENGELIIDHTQYTDVSGKPTGAIERRTVILQAGALLSVSLGETPGGSGYYELTSDSKDKTYAAPHWNAGMNEKMQNYPVAYKRGSKMKVSATFQLPPKVRQAKIRAWGTAGVNIPETALGINSDGTATLGWTETTSTLPNAIRHFDGKNPDKSFKFTWEIQRDGGEWEKIFRETSHTVYVIFNTPTTELRQETLFLLACRNADGLGEGTQSHTITEKIWEEFEKNVKTGVLRVDKTPMTYYNDYRVEHKTTEGLLSNGDGQCSAWSNLFLDVRKVHGLTDGVLKKLIPKNGRYVGFIMKTWSFTGPARFGTYWENVADGYPVSITEEKGYKWSDTPHLPEATYQSGLQGQGNSKPAALFANHQIAQVAENGIYYYDPSYGRKILNIDKFDDENVAGYLTIGVRSQDESYAGKLVYHFEENPKNSNDLTFEGN